jgi:hypothetical protein
MSEVRAPGTPCVLPKLSIVVFALLFACHAESERESPRDPSSLDGAPDVSALEGLEAGSSVVSGDGLADEDGGARLTVQVRVPASEGATPLRPNRSPPQTCVDVMARPEPRTLESSLRGRCVVLVGYFAEEVALVAERSSTSEPERVRWRRYRPFRFVRERNPSLGWPEWVALSAVLVDLGTVDENEPPLPLVGKDLRNVEVVVGQLRPWPRSAPKVWRVLKASRGEGAGPYAQEELPLVVDDLRFVERLDR